MVTRLLRHVAGEVRALMAANGIRRLSEVVGRRDLLEKRKDLAGKDALLDVGTIVGAPTARAGEPDFAEQRRLFAPKRREAEEAAAHRACAGEAAAKKIHAALTFEVQEIRPLADFGQGWEKSL